MLLLLLPLLRLRTLASVRCRRLPGVGVRWVLLVRQASAVLWKLLLVLMGMRGPNELRVRCDLCVVRVLHVLPCLHGHARRGI